MRVEPKQAVTTGFFSAKGGVGKTTLTLNIGYKLAETWEDDVLIVDTNLNAPNLSIYLGRLNPENTIHDVLAGEIPIENAIENVEGIDMIFGSGVYLEEAYRRNLDDCVDPLLEKYKIILFDTPPGLGEDVLSVMDMCDEIMVVTTPDYPSLAGVLNTFSTAERHKVPISGIIINKILGEDFELSGSEIKEALDWPIIASIPNDIKVRESSSAGVPVVKHNLSSPAAKKFIQLSEHIKENVVQK